MKLSIIQDCRICIFFHMTKVLAVILLFIGVWVADTQGQDEQVPLDSDSTIYTIDSELQQQLQLEDFSGYSNFSQAMLYRLEGENYELVIEYESDDRSRRDRKELSATDVEALRKRVTENMSGKNVRVGLNQKGRQGLLIRTGIIGVIEGSLIAAATDAGSEGYIALPLIGGSLGYFVPLFATQDEEVKETTARLTGYGGYQGIAHGLAISAIMGFEDFDSRTFYTITSLTTAGETYAGYYIGQKYNWEVGRARMVKYNGIVGNFYGFGLGTLAVGEDISSELAGASAILGSFGGAWAGYQLSENSRYSSGDAHLYLTSGILGVQLMSNVPVLTDSENARLISGTFITGSSLGFYLAHKIAGKYSLDNSESRIVRLGYGAGYLLGAGLNVLASTDSQTSWLVGSLASATGYAIGLNSILNSENRERRNKAFIKELEMMADVYAGNHSHLINSFYERGGNSSKKSVSFLPQSGNSRDITPMLKFHIGF